MSVAKYSVDQLIMNSPYREPTSYWAHHRQSRFSTPNDAHRPNPPLINQHSAFPSSPPFFPIGSGYNRGFGRGVGWVATE